MHEVEETFCGRLINYFLLVVNQLNILLCLLSQKCSSKVKCGLIMIVVY